MPKSSKLFGGQPSEPEDWCSKHNVPDSRCISCHPELGGTDPADWCKEHGLPESKCTICHPDLLAGGSAEWCPEHGLPEKSCTLCHPEIAVKGKAPASAIEAQVKSSLPGTAPKDPKSCQTHNLRVQFASPAAVRKAGISCGPVYERPMSSYVSVSGETAYDQTRLARVSPKVSGTAFRMQAELGSNVHAGDILGFVDSAEVGRLKGEFLQALATVSAKERLLTSLRSTIDEGQRLVELKAKYLDRVRTAAKESLVAQATVQDAESSLSDAHLQVLNAKVVEGEAIAGLEDGHIQLLKTRQALANLGLRLSIEEMQGLSREEREKRVRLLGVPTTFLKLLPQGVEVGNLIPLMAPFDGVVIERDAVEGEAIDPSRPVFVLADVTKMWLMMEVKQEEAGALSLGQKVVFKTDAAGAETISGELSWISTAADEKTRTVRARAVFENAEGRVRAGTFGSGKITVRESEKATAVLSEAIHWEGCCYVVFVRLTDDIFQTRKVKLGSVNGPFTEIRIGVMPGEVVVTTGSHVLKSEILKSALGAGCCAE
ncbi:MAG: efflux RND transporter periplasmic adaptor subunit [Planctomycetota bacterium]|nr:efflux RND transporter periplasmic adaptor subunit [Planctomycetota bacterium]